MANKKGRRKPRKTKASTYIKEEKDGLVFDSHEDKDGIQLPSIEEKNQLNKKSKNKKKDAPARKRKVPTGETTRITRSQAKTDNLLIEQRDIAQLYANTMNSEEGLDSMGATDATECEDDQDLEGYDEVVCINQQTSFEGEITKGEEIKGSPIINNEVSSMEVEKQNQNDYEYEDIDEEEPKEIFEDELEVNGGLPSASQGEEFNEDDEFSYADGGSANQTDFSYDEPLPESISWSASGTMKDPDPVCSPKKMNLSSLPSAYSKLAERSSSITISPCIDNAQAQAKRKMDHSAAQISSLSYDSLSNHHDITSTLNLKGVTVTKAAKRSNPDSQVLLSPPQSVPEPKADCEINPVPFKKPKLRKKVALKPPEPSKVRTYSVTLYNDSHSKVEGTVTEKITTKRPRKRKNLVAELPIDAIIPGIEMGGDFQTTNPGLEIGASVLEEGEFPPNYQGNMLQFPHFMFDNNELNIIRRPYDEISSPQNVQQANKQPAPKRRGRPPLNKHGSEAASKKSAGEKGAAKKGAEGLPDNSVDLMTTVPNDLEALAPNFPEEMANNEPKSTKPSPKKTLCPVEKNEAVSLINRNTKGNTLTRTPNNTSDCESMLLPPHIKKSQPFKATENRMVGDVSISPVVSDVGFSKLKPQRTRDDFHESNPDPSKDSSQSALKSFSSNIHIERNEAISSNIKNTKNNTVLSTTKSESVQLLPHHAKKQQPFKPPENRMVGDVRISPVVPDAGMAKLKSQKMREELNELNTDPPKDSSQSVLSTFPSSFQNNSQIKIIRMPKIESNVEVSSLKKVPITDSPKKTSLPTSHTTIESKPELLITSNVESSTQKPNVGAPSNEILSKCLTSTFDKGSDVAKPKPTTPSLGLFQGSKSISFHKITPQQKVNSDKQPRTSILPDAKSGTPKEGKHELMITRISKTPSTPQTTIVEDAIGDQSVEIIEPELDSSDSSIDPIYSSDEDSDSTFFKGFCDSEITLLSRLRNEYYGKCFKEVMMEYQRASPLMDECSSDDSCSSYASIWAQSSASGFEDDFCEVSPITKSEVKRVNADHLLEKSMLFPGCTPNDGVSEVTILPTPSNASRLPTSKGDISRRQLSFTPDSTHFESTSNSPCANPRGKQKSVNLNLLQERYNEVSIVRKNHEPSKPSLNEYSDETDELTDYEFVEGESGVLSLPGNDELEEPNEKELTHQPSMRVQSKAHVTQDYKALSSKFHNSSQVTLTCKSTSKGLESKSFVAVKCFKVRLVPFKSVLSDRNSKSTSMDTTEHLGTFQFGESKHIIFSTSESSFKDQFVVSGSQLSKENLSSMCTFVKMFHWGWSNSFDDSVTHLVCGGSYHTRKFLKAVANKSQIITMDWIEDCITHKKLLNPMNYMVNGPGPRSCLISKRRPLFTCYSAQLSPLMNLDYYKFIKVLFTKLGGCLMGEMDYEEEDDDDDDDDRIKVFLYFDEKDVPDEILSELYSSEIWPLKCTWVTDCVRWFRLVPTRHYLHPSFSTVTPSDFYNGCECGKDPLGSDDCTCANNEMHSFPNMSGKEEDEYMYDSSEDVIVLDSD